MKWVYSNQLLSICTVCVQKLVTKTCRSNKQLTVKQKKKKKKKENIKEWATLVTTNQEEFQRIMADFQLDPLGGGNAKNLFRVVNCQNSPN